MLFSVISKWIKLMKIKQCRCIIHESELLTNIVKGALMLIQYLLHLYYRNYVCHQLLFKQIN